MNYTENYHLLKPETSELFDVQHANSNAELIDAAIAAKATLEQVASMLEQIIETGEITEVDIGAVTTLTDFIHSLGFRVGVGTTAEIEALAELEQIPVPSLCIPTDSTDYDDFQQALDDIEEIQADITDLETATADSDWQTASLQSGWSGTVKYRKIGNTVYVRGSVEASSSASAIISILPTGYRPGADSWAAVPTASSTTFASISVTASSGQLLLHAAPGAIVELTINIGLSYLIG